MAKPCGMQVIDNILAPLELYPVSLLQEISQVQKQINSIINIPIHHTGKLELITANADVNLSVAEPIREADADPIIIPMML